MRAACLFLVALAVCLAPSLAAAACAFPSAPRILVAQGAKGAKGAPLVQVWDVADSVTYWTTADPISAAYRAFAAEVPKRVPVTDQFTLLREAWLTGDPSLKQSHAMLSTRAVEWIRPAGCLEKLLLADQHARTDLFERPTGFTALVLHSPNGRSLRIYAMTTNEEGIGDLSPLTTPALRDVRAGWRADIALRNHNFHPGQVDLNGVLTPSAADARFVANLAGSVRLKEAWITNGVHSSRIPSAAFGLFVILPKP